MEQTNDFKRLQSCSCEFDSSTKKSVETQPRQIGIAREQSGDLSARFRIQDTTRRSLTDSSSRRGHPTLPYTRDISSTKFHTSTHHVKSVRKRHFYLTKDCKSLPDDASSDSDVSSDFSHSPIFPLRGHPTLTRRATDICQWRWDVHFLVCPFYYPTSITEFIC